MTGKDSGPCLSAVFVDYDNIYLSLKRKNEEAARRFSKDTLSWLKQIETGALITPNNSFIKGTERRLVMSRCYGNPVPRRNNKDNSTDMNSFPFVRHHFLRAGFEVIDCPPLTAQLKNSSDIRMVMDIRDFLEHDTYFNEFIILSGDADFTPVLHRLRAHARRTVIFANDYTATPYTAICDGEIREADLISFLMEGNSIEQPDLLAAAQHHTLDSQGEDVRDDIMREVLDAISASDKPVPIAYLADRAQRNIGHEKTVGTNWAGFGAFRSFLSENLPKNLALSDIPPYYAYDPARHVLAGSADMDMPKLSSNSLQDDIQQQIQKQISMAQTQPMPASHGYGGGSHVNTQMAQSQMAQGQIAQGQIAHGMSHQMASGQGSSSYGQSNIPLAPGGAKLPAVNNTSQTTLSLQKSIARIHEASQIPPLAPPDYRNLFRVMSQELSEKGLNGTQTITGIAMRGAQLGLDLTRDDIQFLLDVVSEADPWFEQGVSPDLFAGRVRNYVIARCRQNGLQLTGEELELIEAWFIGIPMSETSPEQQSLNHLRASLQNSRNQMGGTGGMTSNVPASQNASSYNLEDASQFPRIVRQHLRG